MKTIARLVATAVTTVALSAAVAGCSAGNSESPNAEPVTQAPTATSSATDGTPVTSRPLSDFADGGYYSFGTPSGHIQCRVVDGTLACQTEGRSHTVADSALCGFYPGVEQGNTRRFGFLRPGPAPCATIIQGDGFDSPHTLAYGQSVTAELPTGRTITCVSAVEGLTCTQAGASPPRGFFLSVDTFTVL